MRDVYLPLDYHTKLPRGFGFVEFSREEDVETALDSLSRNAVLDGVEISVTIAQQGRKSPDSMRSRDHPGGNSDGRRRDGYNRREDRGNYRRGRSRSHSRGYGRYRSRSRSLYRDRGHRYNDGYRRKGYDNNGGDSNRYYRGERQYDRPNNHHSKEHEFRPSDDRRHPHYRENEKESSREGGVPPRMNGELSSHAERRTDHLKLK